MPDPPAGTAVTTAALNPVIALCQGHRCQALFSRHETDALTAMCELARQSRNGIVMSTPCAGVCSHGPVVALGAAREVGGRTQLTLRLLLGPVEQRDVAEIGAFLSTPGPMSPRLESLRLPL